MGRAKTSEFLEKNKTQTRLEERGLLGTALPCHTGLAITFRHNEHTCKEEQLKHITQAQDLVSELNTCINTC